MLATADTEQPKFIQEVTRRDTSGMTTLASVDETVALTSGAYSISTAEELAKLATMTNNGKIGQNTEFVLANDIDLSAYSTGEGWTPIGHTMNPFLATFDGNGHVVSNLYINNQARSFAGLFGSTSPRGGPETIGATICNLGLTNVNITGGTSAGGLVSGGSASTINNCYVTGSITAVGSASLLGFFSSSIISNCYAIGNATKQSGIGESLRANSSTINNCYAAGNIVGIASGTSNSGTVNLMTISELEELVANKTSESATSLNLQVGVNSNSASQIELNIANIDVSALDWLDMSSTTALSTIDEVLAMINEQQTNLGAVENRLMSALDQISVAYDNLVSSLSTIQDADIGEVSSEYIRQQILQQASATLMATANQSPSIALQLL